MTPTFIMAVPWSQPRLLNAALLRKETGGHVIWDEKKDALDTWRRALEAFGEFSGILLEDDVTLTENWRVKIEAVIAEHRTEVIQFFSMRGADLTTGSRSEPGRSFLMNQCHYLPDGAAADLLEFSRTWDRDLKGHDLCVADWMKVRGMRYWLSVPSLVQHKDWSSEIVTGRPKNRQSGTFQ